MTNKGLFVMNRGLSEINKGPFAMNRGLSEINSRHFVINRRPSVAYRMPFMINKGPSVTDKGLFEMNKGPFATDSSPNMAQEAVSIPALLPAAGKPAMLQTFDSGEACQKLTGHQDATDLRL